MINPQQDAEHNWRQVDQAWQAIQGTWNDGTTRYFEMRFWIPLERDVKEYNDELEVLLLDLGAATRAAQAYAVVPKPQRRQVR